MVNKLKFIMSSILLFQSNQLYLRNLFFRILPIKLKYLFEKFGIQKFLIGSPIKFRLLDILAGRKDVSGLTGDVRINGSPLPSNFKRISGYVVQVNCENFKRICTFY